MSRQAHLPPRCPSQKKAITRPSHELAAPFPHVDSESYPRHHKSVSQSFMLEEQPAWLDDLLSDYDSNSKGISHRRSASDSVTLLDGLVPLGNLSSLDAESSGSYDSGIGLESACTYGPNSPRRKGTPSFPENAIVSALSEYVSQNYLECSDVGTFMSEMTQSDAVRDASGSAGEANMEVKPFKRHSGQRSRVRKLQYIAELEKKVEVFQTIESELAVRVASLLQQRAALSVENSRLKQQISRLQQKKLIVNFHYQSLKREAERLRACLTNLPHSKLSTDFRSGSSDEAVSSEIMWQMLDMGKLDLN